MEDEIVKKHIDVIIENTFNTISEVYRTQMENQKIGTYNNNNSSLKFEIMAKQLYVASQRVL